MHIHVFVYIHVYISFEIGNQEKDPMKWAKEENRAYIYTNTYIYVYKIKESTNSLKHRAITNTIKWGRRRGNKGAKELNKIRYICFYTFIFVYMFLCVYICINSNIKIILEYIDGYIFVYTQAYL